MLENNNYECLQACFFYIDQILYSSGLVKRLENREFSSFMDYAGLRNDNLVNTQLAKDIIHFDEQIFIEQSYILLEDEAISGIW